MNIRTINYTVYANGTISPVSPQDAGVAGDHDVTRVVFNVAAITDNSYLYRIQHVDAAGCVNATENLIRTDNTVSCSLPRGWTMVGGTATIQLVVTEVDENDNTEAILYTFSGKLYYEPRDPGLLYDEDDLGRGLSGILAAADSDKTATEIAAAAAKLDAQIAVDAANEAAKLVKDIKVEARDILAGGALKPRITFIDDDARSQFPEKWNGIMADKGITVTCAVPASKIGTGGYMTWDTIAAEKALGVDFVMHGYAHESPSPYNGTNRDAIISDITAAKNAMAAHDLPNDILVYPYNQSSLTARNVLLDYVKMAIAGPSGLSWALNVPPVRQMVMYRMNMVSDDGSLDPDLDTLKSYVDKTVDQNGWLILMSHAYQPAFDDSKIADIKTLIDYARAQGAEIVNAHEGMNLYRNPVYSADFEEGGAFAVGVDGSVLGSSVEFKILAKDGDQTDEIQNALNAYKAVMLGDGTFTVTGLTLGKGMTLKGSGWRSKLVLDSSVASGACITSSDEDVHIFNLCLDGGLTTAPADDTGTRHAISLSGNHCMISNCWITGFSGAAITLSGQLGKVDRCNARTCGIGLSLGGANNTVTGTNATNNVDAIKETGSGTAFTGCVFSGKGLFTDSTGDVISGCKFGNSFAFTLSGSTMVAVNGCTFGTAPSASDSTKIWFESCFLANGTHINIHDFTHEFFSTMNKKVSLSNGASTAIQVKATEAVLMVSSSNATSVRGAWILLGGSSTNAALKASVITISAATDISVTPRNVADQYDFIDIANSGTNSTRLGFVSITTAALNL